MFCPKCATQNLDGASFCRSCGANVSLIPQALTGQLPQARDDEESYGARRRRRRGGEPSLDSAFKTIFMGIGFLLVSLALAFSRVGYGWWFWMLIPAFSMLGSGISQYMRLKERERKSFLPGAIGQNSMGQSSMGQSSMPPRRHVDEFPTRRNTGELVPPPPSVTEGTTRHLGAEAPTRHLDDSN